MKQTQNKVKSTLEFFKKEKKKSIKMTSVQIKKYFSSNSEIFSRSKRGMLLGSIFWLKREYLVDKNRKGIDIIKNNKNSDFSKKKTLVSLIVIVNKAPNNVWPHFTWFKKIILTRMFMNNYWMYLLGEIRGQIFGNLS